MTGAALVLATLLAAIAGRFSPSGPGPWILAAASLLLVALTGPGPAALLVVALAIEAVGYRAARRAGNASGDPGAGPPHPADAGGDPMAFLGGFGPGIALAAAAPLGSTPLWWTAAATAAFVARVTGAVGADVSRRSRGEAHLIPTLRRVPAGTQGAVSPAGAGAAVAAALLLAAVAGGLDLAGPGESALVVLAGCVGAAATARLRSVPPAWRGAVGGLAAGLLAYGLVAWLP